MAGGIIGEAWVVVRPDLTGFTSSLIAGANAAVAQAQAAIKDIIVPVKVDKAGALAQTAAVGAAMNAAAVPITFTVQIKSAEALAQLAMIQAIASLAGGAAGGGGGGGGGFATGAAAAGGNNGGNRGPFAGLLTGAALTKLLGFGPGGGTGAAIPFTGVAMAGAFSALSLAGLGLEHVFATLIGLAASLAGAIGGGLLLALGAAVAAVGMGSDMLVMSSTIADTKTLGTALTAIQTAQVTYGKNSAQAAAATTNLNVQMQLLGNTAGVKAELGLAQAAQALNKFWDQATSSARVAAVGFLTPFLAIAYTYIPMINAAATTNFTIMTAAFKPLIAYIDGPAKAVFTELEGIFAKNLPTAVDALTQGVEFLVKTFAFLAPLTGGFTKAIDDLLTRANSANGFATWEHWMTILIGLFHTWYDFFKILAIDIVDFFKLTAGLGSGIIQALTGMLNQLHKWLNLTTTQTSLRNLFQVHKQEVLELLQLLPPLLGALAKIYITVAPALTLAFTGVLTVIVNVLKAVTSNPWGAWLVGIGLILTKLGLLGTALGLIKGAASAVFGLGGAAESATSAKTGLFGLGGGIQKVYVVNWAQIGGSGITSAVTGISEGAAAPVLGAIGGGGITGLATALAPVAAAVVVLLGGIAILNEFSKHPTSPVVPGPGTGGAPTGPGSNVARIQQAYAATWQALLDSSNAAYKTSGLFQKNLQTDLVAAGVPLSQVAGDAELIEKAFTDGKIKTAAQLQLMIQQLTHTGAALVATTLATENIKFNTTATSTIYYDFKNKLFGYLKDVTDQLLFQGLNTKQAATGTSEIATLWKTHKITTQAQMALAVKNYIDMTIASGGIPPTLNQLEGILAGTTPDLKKFASKSGFLPAAVQNLLNGLNAAAGIMTNIKALILGGSDTAAGELAKIRQWALTGTGPHAGGGFIPPGMWGTASENEIVLGGRTGAMVLTAAQSRGAGGVYITQYISGSTKSEVAIEVQKGNTQLIRMLQAGRR